MVLKAISVFFFLFFIRGFKALVLNSCNWIFWGPKLSFRGAITELFLNISGVIWSQMSSKVKSFIRLLTQCVDFYLNILPKWKIRFLFKTKITSHKKVLYCIIWPGRSSLLEFEKKIVLLFNRLFQKIQTKMFNRDSKQVNK